MQHSLRIIQVINVRWFNATAWYGLNLSRLLLEAGHEVRVLGLSGTESFAKAESMGLSPSGLPLTTSNPLIFPGLLGRLRALTRDFRPHIVNCHRGEGVPFWGAIKASGAAFSLVRTRGDQRVPKGNWANRFLHTHLVDAVIATNTRTAAQCRTVLEVPEHRLFTIPGGVDTKIFFPDAGGRAAVRKQYGWSDTDMVIGLLGRFDTVKGQRELMEAVSAIRKTGKDAARPKLRLMLAGFPTSEDSRRAVERWIHDYGLEDCALVTGRVTKTAPLINAMDVGVVASQGSEAIARAALEIMACGVPLVGTDVGVMPDLLSPQALAPAGDAASLRALVERAAFDSDFREDLRREQAEHMTCFSEAEFLKQTLAAYAAVLPDKTQGRAP